MNASITAPTWPSADGVWHHLHLAPEALGAGAPGVADAAIVVERGAIAWVGAQANLPDAYRQLPTHEGHGAWVTPGLVDCHTHLVYGGQRANEFAMRLPVCLARRPHRLRFGPDETIVAVALQFAAVARIEQRVILPAFAGQENRLARELCHQTIGVALPAT